MQATGTAPRLQSSNIGRNLSWFLAVPVTAAVLLSIILALGVSLYQQGHTGLMYTGVSVWGVDLSGMTKGEARQALQAAFPYPEEESISLVDSRTERRWLFRPQDLGLALNVEATLEATYDIGRSGGPFNRLKQQINSWYYGLQVAPIIVFDEGVLDQAIDSLAAEIDLPATDAQLSFNGSSVGYTIAQVGRNLDRIELRNRLIVALTGLRHAEIHLLIHETPPRITDTGQAAQKIQFIMSEPMTLYLREPLAGVDLDRITVPVEEMVKWVRVQSVENAQGKLETEVLIDQNALRTWLSPFETLLQRDPVNARFYFDDKTHDLVLVESHINGRALDVDATANMFLQQVMTPNRSMPFVIKDIVPVVHTGATNEELRITELVSESTTWFYGSSDERKHNIARAASNFYGIVIGPGQEFSFNEYLGDVSAEQGYETGLIIYGGRTIEGVGGGVCQVSTTAFQAAFWAGFPISERWEHGYQVGYYDDGEGPGMDATVYSPLVDLRFINDTPNHLLIENYYNESSSSLTFKFYSTSMGRTVVKEGPVIENIVPSKPDIWELNEELEAGEIEQVDWAVEGADVTVTRDVFNSSGELIRQESFFSRYIPWQNIYQYGPGTELPEPEDPAEEVENPDGGTSG